MSGLEGRAQKPFYVTDDVLKQITEERKILGLTFQAFVTAAVLEKLERCRDERDRRRRSKRDQREERERERPAGLGIRERLARPTDEPEAPAPTGSPAPVSISVTTGGPSSAAPDLSAMASMIVAVPASMRRGVLEKAGEALARAAKTREEAEDLVTRLDAEIKRIEAKPQTVLERVRARSAKE